MNIELCMINFLFNAKLGFGLLCFVRFLYWCLFIFCPRIYIALTIPHSRELKTAIIK